MSPLIIVAVEKDITLADQVKSNVRLKTTALVSVLWGRDGLLLPCVTV